MQHDFWLAQNHKGSNLELLTMTLDCMLKWKTRFELRFSIEVP